MNRRKDDHMAGPLSMTEIENGCMPAPRAVILSEDYSKSTPKAAMVKIEDSIMPPLDNNFRPCEMQKQIPLSLDVRPGKEKSH